AGFGGKFEPLELAVTFDKDWSYGLSNPHAVARSKSITNAQGQTQGTCVHLGNCDIGCDVAARNTLDLNYLAVAEQKHAEIRELHLVNAIGPQDGGYRVSYNRITPNGLTAGSATAKIVIVAAGSLGSTELLLRCREQQTLPALSARLGLGWSSNGDFLTPAIHPFRRVDPTHGPTITAAINLLDHGVDGQDVFVEDGGFPNLVEGVLRRSAANRSVRARRRRKPEAAADGEPADRSRDAVVRAGARRRRRPAVPEQREARSRVGHREVPADGGCGRARASTAGTADAGHGADAVDVDRVAGSHHAASARRVQHGHDRRPPRRRPQGGRVLPQESIRRPRRARPEARRP